MNIFIVIDECQKVYVDFCFEYLEYFFVIVFNICLVDVGLENGFMELWFGIQNMNLDDYVELGEFMIVKEKFDVRRKVWGLIYFRFKKGFIVFCDLCFWYGLFYVCW